MQKEILEYLDTQRLCVVAVEMMNGAPHAATVHFAHQEEPFGIIIQTSPQYRKSEPLLSKPSVRAAVVVGMEEATGGKDVTLQIDGEAHLLGPEEQHLKERYLAKFPKKDAKFADDIFFVVIPTWWRFTRWNTPKGKIVITS